MIDLLEIEKSLVLPHIVRGGVAVDFTMGNGHDTLWLSQNVGADGKVYAFDIQQQALDSTSRLLAENGAENVTLILDSHANVKNYVHEPICVGMFNLGYLPGSDTDIITESDNTLKTFIKAYEYLQDGYIAITFYRGHKGGNDEYIKIDDYIKKHGISIQEKYREFKHANEPLSYIIRKHIS